tara:strand:+ start:615 stop:1064 length:450 start_codon:yes stop_codon:yes gene_type:complete
MGNFNTLRSGLNHAPAYQVSGRPWASGSCVAPGSGSTGVKPTSQKVTFPYVTRWVKVQVSGAAGSEVRVAFSQEGLNDCKAAGQMGGDYWTAVPGDHTVLELKVSELYFMSNGTTTATFDVIAGLTSVATTGLIFNTTGSSWSGSAGVG